MIDIYEIAKPTFDSNNFTVAIKYITLFIILFLASWIAIPLFIANGRGTRINTIMEFMTGNTVVFNILISLVIIAWFIYRIKKRYVYGEVFKLIFDDSKQQLKVWTINTMNNEDKVNGYDYENLDFKFYESNDALFGKQRILHILNKDVTVHEINFDRTAWCRNDRLKNLMQRLKAGSKIV